MYVIKEDAAIVNTSEIRHMLEQYAEKFGEDFILFNYVDFPGIKGKQRPAEMYREALINALEKDEPTRIESRWEG